MEQSLNMIEREWNCEKKMNKVVIRIKIFPQTFLSCIFHCYFYSNEI
jgi:hypothetical protein